MKKSLVLLPILALTSCVMAPNPRINNDTSSSENPLSSESVSSNNSEKPSSTGNTSSKESSSKIEEGNTSSFSDGGKTNIGKVKIWVDSSVLSTTRDRIDDFVENNPNYTFTYEIRPVTMYSVTNEVVFDPENAADLYLFAQDGLRSLIHSKAIMRVPDEIRDIVINSHIEAAIDGATINGNLYAYPAAFNSTYFMYYNKSDLAGVDINDFNAIMARVKSIGKKVYMNVANAWYNAAFFYGAGAHSEWTIDSDLRITDYDDTYNSAAGKVAVQGMHELFSDSTAFVDGSAAGEAFQSGAAVVISGIWDKIDAINALGDKLGVATLPNYTVDGVSYPLTPFSSCSYIGVKPQRTNDRAKFLSELALYLSDEEPQIDRFNEAGWIPTNLGAIEHSTVSEDKVTNVAYLQTFNSVPQGSYPGDWWYKAGLIGMEAIQPGIINPAEILKSYEDSLEELLN